MDVLIIVCNWLVSPLWFEWVKKDIVWKTKEKMGGEGNVSLSPISSITEF